MNFWAGRDGGFRRRGRSVIIAAVGRRGGYARSLRRWFMKRTLALCGIFGLAVLVGCSAGIGGGNPGSGGSAGSPSSGGNGNTGGSVGQGAGMADGGLFEGIGGGPGAGGAM